MSSSHNHHDQKLVTVAGFNHMATLVIINVTSIENYSQVVPTWNHLKNVSMALDLQNWDLELENTTLHNAIIIPITILQIILSSLDNLHLP